MNGHLCRCGTYPRILTAIKQAAAVMAKGGQVTMTGFLHEKEFSRKTFLKGGGALIVGFSVAGRGLAGKARRPGSTRTRATALTSSRSTRGSRSMPTTRRRSRRAGSGRARGRIPGLLMIAGEELDMDMSQLEFVMADTGLT